MSSSACLYLFSLWKRASNSNSFQVVSLTKYVKNNSNLAYLNNPAFFFHSTTSLMSGTNACVCMWVRVCVYMYVCKALVLLTCVWLNLVTKSYEWTVLFCFFPSRNKFILPPYWNLNHGCCFLVVLFIVCLFECSISFYIKIIWLTVNWKKVKKESEERPIFIFFWEVDSVLYLDLGKWNPVPPAPYVSATLI